MRQLKGQVKENKKQKLERRKENIENQQKLKTLVLPSLGAVAIMIILYVFLKTRPMQINSDL